MMELKKFEAPTLSEALQVVKQALGPEAIILSTKNNRTGFGLMNKSSVEVTAAVSREALARKNNAETRLTAAQKKTLLDKPAQRVAAAYDVLSGQRLERTLFADTNSTDVSPNTAEALLAFSPQRRALAPSQAAPAAQRPLTQRRYADIRDDDSPAEAAGLIERDRTHIRQPSSLIQRPMQRPVQRVEHRMESAPTYSSTTSTQLLPKLLAELIESGVDQELVREAGDELKIVMLREHVNKEDVLRLHLGRIIMSRVRVGRSLTERLRSPTTPRAISFVGPTGVGKTTTIAKIAAELVINQKRPVTLVTTDTYKIAAIEQLQTYANILRISLEVCPTAESLAQLAGQLGGDQVMLIDTAGYGPKDEKKLIELKETLSGVRTEVHLCLGAMIRDRDLIENVRRFKIFDPEYLVITKLDETNSFGGLYNVAVRSHLPLSYFTMGQRVPEDMEVATKERVADLLLHISG